MILQKIVDENFFLSLGEQWNNLLDRSAFKTIFLSWQWQKTWWQEFRHGRTLYVLLLRDEDGQARGLAPLYLEGPGAGKSILKLIGDNDISDHLSIMAEKGREEEVCGLMVKYLTGAADDWDEISIGPLKQESVSCNQLAAEAAKCGLEVKITACDTSPWVSLPRTWDDYLRALGQKERHELRRKLRKAAREAALRYYSCEDLAALDADMDSFLGLMEKSAPEKAAFLGESMKRFFKKAAIELFKAGWLELSFLEVNGMRIAANLCFDYCGSIQLYNSGFNPSYRHLSAGIVLTADNLRRAIEKGRAEFDFLRGSEGYKYSFGAKDEPLFRVSIKRR